MSANLSCRSCLRESHGWRQHRELSNRALQHPTYDRSRSGRGTRGHRGGCVLGFAETGFVTGSAAMNAATAFAPATVSNVAVGFDILGFAIEGVGDVVTVSKIERPGVLISEIVVNTGSLSEIALPSDPKQNAATAGLAKLRADLELEFGFEVRLRKGIAIGSGMGGSAASAVGAIVAANELLPGRLSKGQLLKYALMGEEAASGSAHSDNIAPCLFGGLTLVLATDPVRVVSIPVPKEILTVLVHPRHRVETRRARDILKTEVTLADHVRQSAHRGALI